MTASGVESGIHHGTGGNKFTREQLMVRTAERCRF